MAVIQNRGEYQWRAMIRRQGFPTYSRTFERQRDAKDWATEVEAAIGRRDLAEVRRLTATGDELGGTIADLVDKYVAEVLPSRNQAGAEKPRLARIKDALGKLTVPMLSPLDVAKWRDARLAEGAALGTVRHDLNTLSKLLGHAISEWGVEGLRNVVRDVKKPEMAKGRDRRVSVTELEYLLRAARFAPPDRLGETPAPGLAELITLAVETSMRLGELLALEWRHVDLKRRTAHLSMTKNGEARTVALSSTAVATLKDLKSLQRAQHDKLVAEASKQPTTTRRERRSVEVLEERIERLATRCFGWAGSDSVSHPFRRCVARAIALYKADSAEAGKKPAARFLADVRFHDLRHEATSRLFEKGLNPMEVASMTGHKSMQMLKRYTHVEASKVAAKLG